jgi:pyruvate, orthophosphate dikinase
MSKFVYSFGDGKADGDMSLRNLLGGKGSNLAQMSKIGIPVPLGFTITTKVCDLYYQNNKNFTEELKQQVLDSIKKLEEESGKRFADTENPLLVSVRSGARVSMPGMLDTVLNLGMNDEVAEVLAKKSGNACFAYDSYRRFLQMYGNVVLDIDHHDFEHAIELKKIDKGVTNDVDLDVADLKDLVKQFKKIIKDATGSEMPSDPIEQLWGSISAVFNSWMNNRAIVYRKLNDISEDWGTAVNIQAMVFGNMGNDSATGVAFTRDPSTGEKVLYGEYLINAQGEDVVAGIRTPQPITKLAKERQGIDLPAMEETMPDLFQEFGRIYKKLEAYYRDMQDIEFTIEKGKLWILQTRNGKRTAAASVRSAVEMVAEGLIDKEEALERIDPKALDQLLHPTLDPKASKNVICHGLPASPGAAVGKIVFTANDAEVMTAKKEKVILLRQETSPEDVSGMSVAEGILTERGGMTSHAAVVARGMGKPCISGAGDLQIDLANKRVTISGKSYHEGDILTIDGARGEVMEGAVKMQKPSFTGDFAKVMKWADEVRRLKVRTNAETPVDCKVAREFGAEGIGLCRTEHMFFEAERIISVREMILAQDLSGRENALAKLLPIQRQDFVEIFKVMHGVPVTIRLLDPPLHEFLPKEDKEIKELADVLNIPVSVLMQRVETLQEFNPMLGHRGCRLGITYPEIYKMQARAIFEAAIEVSKDKQCELPDIEIMVPLIFGAKELKILRSDIEEVAEDVFKAAGINLNYMIGTMIELPRAALRAGEIAKEAEFFSFGTNDLTQTCFGMSRDDSGNFINDYLDKKIFDIDPFVQLDQEAVGELIEIAVERGRKTRSDIKLGICGEHGGDPKSIDFCHRAGLDYVSCSPYRVPIARLAAAQAEIRHKKNLKKAS